MVYSLDFVIETHKEDLKRIIAEYSEELNNKNFTVIYKKFANDYFLIPAFTALLLKNNINPLIYMNEVPKYFAKYLDIKEFVIPDNITEIEYCAFENCSILTDVTIGSGTTIIHNYAFNNCERLTSIRIPKSIHYIWADAFRNCSKLKDIYYEGSKEDWENIEMEDDNYLLYNATIHYNS